MRPAPIENTSPVFEGDILIQAPQHSDPLHDFHGTTLKYCLYGSLEQPVSIVMGGISAGAYIIDTNTRSGNLVKGWWDRSVGLGKTIDLATNAVLGIDYLPDNALAEKFFAQNRSVTTQDQAYIVKYLLDTLAIKQLHAFVGSSYGGMVALAFAELFPAAINKLVVLCASDKANSRTTAFRSIQRSIIQLASDENKDAAISLARSLGMIVYRSHLEFEQRFSNNPVLCDSQWTFPVTDYIYSRGKSLAQHFSPERFTLLSESCDLHQVRAENIKTDTLLIGFDTDDIVKSGEILDLGQKLAGPVNCKIFNTIYGHDAFIVEQESFADDIRNFLNS